MFQNQNTNNNEEVGATAMPLDDVAQQLQLQQLQQQQLQQQQQQQNVIYSGVQSNQNKGVRKKPYVKITEQPASKALRFRYECEGRSAGSIPGVNSTPESKTYPTIEIVGYKGRAVVVVSCVTKDAPYRPHPHNLVGKEGCKKGVCTLEINSETMRAVFSNLGIQCVKKKDIEGALKAREEIRVDPFKTGFSHRLQPSNIDLNVVRLCFQVFMESDQKGRFTQPLPPVVSDPIFDKKAMSDLVICRLCSCSATVLGNTQIILLCEKVAKEDISVRFYEEKNNEVVWEGFGDFQHTDVHKQTAIAFKTPKYRSIDITEPAKVFIQLLRPSDGVTSQSLPFEYIPLDSGRQTFWNLGRNLKRKPDQELFEQILNIDSANEPEAIIANNTHIITDLDDPSIQAETISTTTTVEFTNSSEPMETEDLVEMENQQAEVDNILDEKVRELEQQTLTAVGEQEMTVRKQSLEFPAQICATDKINQWMKSNEEQNYNEPEKNWTATHDINDDKTLSELLEQVVELDEIYSDHVHRRNSNQQDLYKNPLQSLEGGESFDDAATYTSLQIAFKHPVNIPVKSISSPINSQPTQQEQQQQPQQQLQELHNPSFVNNNMTILNNIVNLEQKIVTEDTKLPPLPPKRMRKVDGPNTDTSDTNQFDVKQQAPIIIMKTPERVPSPRGSVKSKSGIIEGTVPSPKPKKSGFFSKIFSRRKSKPELSSENNNHSSKLGSRETSIQHFPLNDTNRSSMRSVQSLQANSLPTSPTKVSNKPNKISKPVGRSVSSVSGKRPTHLNAEVIHIPLKGESVNSLPQNNEAYSHASTITLDRRTVSALQLADIPINDGHMELIAIADRQSLRNLCDGELNIQLDPNVDLTEAEHFALYTSVPPQATMSEFDENSAYYAAVDAGEILTPNEIAKRLTTANRAN